MIKSLTKFTTLHSQVHGYESNTLTKAMEWFEEISGGSFAFGSHRNPEIPIPEGEKLLVLCMTPRSGSTALSSALHSSNVMGRGGERLQRKPNGLLAGLIGQGVTSLDDAVDRLIAGAKTQNGVCQIKCDYAQLLPFLMDPGSRKRLGHAKFVYLTREDVLGQAISRYKGFRTGYWHSVQIKGEKIPEPEYDFEEIYDQVTFLSSMMSAYERLFATMGIVPLRITYEQVVTDAPALVKRISEHLGVELTEEINLSDGGHEKVATGRNEEMRDRFIADFGALTE